MWALFKWLSQIMGYKVSLSTFKRDPVILNKVVSRICGVSVIEGCIEIPVTEQDKKKNIKYIFKYLQMIGIQVQGVDKRDVLEGRKLVIPLLENLFRHYLAKRMGQNVWITMMDKDAISNFKKFINDCLKSRGYRVMNFTTDWHSGMALGALVNSIQSDLCPYWREYDTNEGYNNVSDAMIIAEDALKIRKIIRPQDMSQEDVEELPIIMYLSQFLELDPGFQKIETAYNKYEASPSRSLPITQYDRQPSTSSQYLEPRNEGTCNDAADVMNTPPPARPPLPEQPDRQVTDLPLPHPLLSSCHITGSLTALKRDKDASTLRRELYKLPFKKVHSIEEFWHQMDDNDVQYNPRLKALTVDGDLKLGRQLGIGHFGRVCEARFTHPEDGFIMCAAKMVIGDSIVLKTVQDFLNEAWVAKGFRHENVIRLIDFIFFDYSPCMLLPLYANGDLRDYLKTNKYKITPDNLLQYAIDVTRGVKYITDKGYIHRDLAARNCLVTDDGRVVIADFGFMRDVMVSAYKTVSQTSIPAWRWLALEILEGDMLFNVATDVWSLAVVYYEVFSYGTEPYEDIVDDIQLRRYLKSGQRLEKPPAACPDMYRLMTSCWERSPDNRPNLSAIIVDLEDIQIKRSMLLPGFQGGRRKEVVFKQNPYSRNDPPMTDDDNSNYQRIP